MKNNSSNKITISRYFFEGTRTVGQNETKGMDMRGRLQPALPVEGATRAPNIEWPELNFEELKDYYVENKPARWMYKVVIAMLFLPQILIRAFYEVLRFRA